jgi:hypothetical protein
VLLLVPRANKFNVVFYSRRRTQKSKSPSVQSAIFEAIDFFQWPKHWRASGRYQYFPSRNNGVEKHDHRRNETDAAP